MRRLAFSALAVALFAGCSGGDTIDPGRVDTATSIDGGTVAPTPTTSPAEGSLAPPSEGTTVVVDATVDGEVVRFDGDLAAATDPFGEFVSCSGGRATFTSYTVVAARTFGGVRALTIATDDIVDAAGIHDATVRVEFAGGEVADATGTMTIEAGYRAGSFTAFTDSGELVEGAFECGVGPEPAPFVLGDAGDGRLDTIDAVALLRSPNGERLVGFAAGSGDAAVFECPAVDGSAPVTDVVVHVEGSASIGAVTSFELVGGDSPSLTMRVGTTDYRFDDVSVTDAGSTGTFSASADGVTVDGAYRCS